MNCGGVKNGKIEFIHHLKEQVLKFKKNPTLAQKSEKLRGLSIFYFFFLVIFSDPTPYFSFLEKKKEIVQFLSDFGMDATKLFGRTSGTHLYAQKNFLDSPG